MKRIISALCLIAALAVLTAGCGDGEGGSGGGYSGKGGGAYGAGIGGETAGADGGGDGGGDGAAIVKAAPVGDLGTVIVDSQGLTLYDFHRDEDGKSSCYGACARAWPPLLTEGEPRAEAGAVASRLGTTKRRDGSVQVTYSGWPLYTYAGDREPGEANGNDIDQFGAEWYALRPDGEEPGD